MTKIFEVIGEKGRVIYLTKERWHHIRLRHPDLGDKLELVKQTVQNPSFISKDQLFFNLYYYHYFDKSRQRYLILIIKYLNDKGFIITAYYSRQRKP